MTSETQQQVRAAKEQINTLSKKSFRVGNVIDDSWMISRLCRGLFSSGRCLGQYFKGSTGYLSAETEASGFVDKIAPSSMSDPNQWKPLITFDSELDYRTRKGEKGAEMDTSSVWG